IAPRIIEWASIAAYCFPSFITVRASVASATEGAAPNNPAKVFGFKRAEMNEKTQTTRPPIKKRTMMSVKLSSVRARQPCLALRPDLEGAWLPLALWFPGTCTSPCPGGDSSQKIPPTLQAGLGSCPKRFSGRNANDYGSP